MDENKRRDTHPLPTQSKFQWLATRRGITIVAVVSLVMLLVAIIGGVYIAKMRSQIGNVNIEITPPVSLAQLATEFPELASILQDPSLDSVYKDFLLVYQEGGPDAAYEMAVKRGLVNDQDELRLTLELDTTDTGPLVQQLESQGIKVTAVSENLVDIAIPLAMLTQIMQSDNPGSLLQAIGDLEHVIRIRVPRSSLQDAVETESIPIIGADVWHLEGFSGAGVKVGVLDGGFDGYKRLLGSDLPANVIARSFSAGTEIDNTGSVHGTACAEIVYDVAPEAEIYIAIYETDAEFRQSVDWLISQGVTVISHSRSWTYGPMDGSGPDAKYVDSIAARGILWVNSAGNRAEEHYRATFTDTDGDGWHEFDTGDELMGFMPSGRTLLVLNWDAWDTGDQDYDLFIMDKDGNEIASAENIQDGPGDEAAEYINYNFTDKGPYSIAFYAKNITRPGVFDFYIRDAALEYYTPEHSICTPADARGAFTVGATYWSDDTLESYSSRGPTNDGRIKPDISAPAGVNSAAYGHAFYGTSASTPHVAGAAALVWGAYPEFTREQVIDFLQTRALDLGPNGADNGFGFGRLFMGEIPTGSAPVVPPVIAPAITETQEIAPAVTHTATEITAKPTDTKPAATKAPTRTPKPVFSTEDTGSLGLFILLGCVFASGALGLGGIGLLGGVLYLNRSRKRAKQPIYPDAMQPAVVSGISQEEPWIHPQIVEEGVCPRCGSPHRPQARFCTTCGQSFTSGVPEPQAQLFCNQCGQPLRSSSKFCPSCGYRR